MARHERRAMIVDFHTHVVPNSLPPPGGEKLWPSIALHGADEADIMIGGRSFRRVDRRSWDVAARLADMDADGVEIQVLSPMPELLSYWFGAEEGERFCRAVNEHTLSMVAERPERFRGLGALPLQDPERAVRMLPELRRAGFVGIEIGTHINGMPLGDARLAPVFAAAEQNGLLVMVHALHPAGVERIGGAPDMAAAAVFPLETALAATSLIVGGVLERHPGLRIMLCHGGGTLPAILPRLDHAWRCGMSLAKVLSVPPSEIARRFYYDTIVYGADVLHLLARTAVPDRIVLGSDYPFAVMQTDPAGFLRRSAPELTEATASAARSLLQPVEAVA